MTEETGVAVAESPTAPAAIDLAILSPEQRHTWRTTGELPKAESAPAKETSEPAKAEAAPESDPEKLQDKKPHKGTPAPERKAELAAEIQELLKKRDDARKELEAIKAKPADPPPAEKKPELTRPKPTRADVDEKGYPKYTGDDDFLEALSDWKTEQKLVEFQRQQLERAFAEDTKSRIDAIKQKYPDAEKVIVPAIQELAKPEALDPVVYGIIGKSPVAIDLIFALASDPEAFKEFLVEAKADPGKAIRRAVLIEKLVMDELSGKSEVKAERDAETGKFKSKEEAKPAQTETKTAKPLTEVGGRGTPANDVLENAVKAGDYRAAKAEMTRRALASVS